MKTSLILSLFLSGTLSAGIRMAIGGDAGPDQEPTWSFGRQMN